MLYFITALFRRDFSGNLIFKIIYLYLLYVLYKSFSQFYVLGTYVKYINVDNNINHSDLALNMIIIIASITSFSFVFISLLVQTDEKIPILVSKRKMFLWDLRETVLSKIFSRRFVITRFVRDLIDNIFSISLMGRIILLVIFITLQVISYHMGWWILVFYIFFLSIYFVIEMLYTSLHYHSFTVFDYTKISLNLYGFDLDKLINQQTNCFWWSISNRNSKRLSKFIQNLNLVMISPEDDVLNGMSEFEANTFYRLSNSLSFLTLNNYFRDPRIQLFNYLNIKMNLNSGNGFSKREYLELQYIPKTRPIDKRISSIIYEDYLEDLDTLLDPRFFKLFRKHDLKKLVKQYETIQHALKSHKKDFSQKVVELIDYINE